MGKADNLTTFMFLFVLKSGSLNLQEPTVTAQGLLYLYVHNSRLDIYIYIYIYIYTQHVTFLGAFGTLQKVTISFVMSVRPSVCPHGTSRLPLDGFS